MKPKRNSMLGMKAGLLITGLSAAALGAATAAESSQPRGVYLPADQRAIYLERGKTPGDYRNLALNPTAATGADPGSFPHATSNSEYNQREFAARCAIDGSRRNHDVHGCGSWGPHKQPDIWWRLDFGRPVEIDKLVLLLRAAWKPDNKPHDSYWKEATVEFSDGTRASLQLAKTADAQEFPVTKRTVTWLALKDLKPAEDRWCALCEFEAWGRDATVQPGPGK